MSRTIKATLAAVLLSGAAFGTALADSVKIKTLGGGMAISGELVEFDENFLTILTKMGRVRIPRSASICEGVGCPAAAVQAAAIASSGDVLITGSQSIGAALLPRLLEGFASQLGAKVTVDFDGANRRMVSRLQADDGSELTKVSLRLGSTASAFDDLLNGDASLILSSRRATAREAQKFIDAGLGDIRNEGNEAVIALDGLAILVEPGNDLPALTMDDLVGIVSGEITDWSAVGGNPGPINLFLPPATDEIFQSFSDEILRPRRRRPVTNADQRFSGVELSTAVAQTAGAIGLAPLSQRGDARPLPLKLGCGLLAEPDSFSVKAEEYPLTRRIYLYSRNAALPGPSSDFFTFAQSARGQDGVQDIGFIDQRIVKRTVNEQGLRFVSAIVAEQSPDQLSNLQDMASAVLTATRLSPTLRFNTGSSELDTKALSDIKRLVEVLGDPEFEGKEVILLGFTDAVGRPDINQIIATERAAQVREQLTRQAAGRVAVSAINSIGYGPIAPVGCNDEASGREANRRVEVWVR